MAQTGKQSPLGVNVTASHLQDIGFHINPTAAGYMGANKSTAGAYAPGSIVNDTALFWVTYAIWEAYKQYVAGRMTATTYNKIITIGSNIVECLGNTPPKTYTTYDPRNRWHGEANTGYYVGTGDTGEEQGAKWLPWSTTNPNVEITKWGYIRTLALQAWNEFNWNGIPTGPNMPEYKDFVGSFLQAEAFINYVNVGINAFKNSPQFLKGTYSNMNDLISADITGVSLSTTTFGQDLITAGRTIDLSQIQTFGLPSVLLQTIKKNKILTQSLSMALLASGLSTKEIDEISRGAIDPVSKKQEQQIYGAFLIITGQDLLEILFALNCKTRGLTTLADLLNIKKLFPNSYLTLTVPIYNATPGPTNSKTYYPIYERNTVSPRLESPRVKQQIGVTIPPGPPPVIEPAPPAPPPAPVLIAVQQVEQEARQTEFRDPGNFSIAPPPPAPVRQVGGGCVVLESYVPFADNDTYNTHIVRQAYQLCDGHKIKLADETTLEIHIGEIVKAINEYQPCIRITTEDGVSLVCSTTAPIPTLDKGVIPAPTVLFEKVAVLRDGKPYWSTVTCIEDVGMKFVRAIDTGNNSFWAGEVDGSYILHHNITVRNNLVNKN